MPQKGCRLGTGKEAHGVPAGSGNGYRDPMAPLWLMTWLPLPLIQTTASWRLEVIP